jgi:hypothetical protein
MHRDLIVGRALAPEPCHARASRAARLSSHQRRNRSGPRKEQGVGPAFRSSVMPISPNRSPDERSDIRERRTGCSVRPGYRFAHPGDEENRRKRNADKRGSATAAPCGAARALRRARSSVGVPPRLSPKGVSHPEGSASGQASWDAVRTGVTCLRLSQSREAPPAPVIMPEDMMPKPPGSGLQIRPQAPPSPPWRDVPPRHVLHAGRLSRT